VLSSSDDSDFLSPLLLRQEGDDRSGLISMETTCTSMPETSASTSIISSWKRVMYGLLRVGTLADVSPSCVQAMIVGTGKFSGVFVLAIYLAMVSLWLPFWLLACLVTEGGVYVIVIASLWYLGRAVIRMIAFPGASHKVQAEVESEFAKYSVRMLVASANCLRELATALLQVPTDGSAWNTYELTPLWKRTLSYKDRSIGVYSQVLEYLYQQQQQGETPTQQLQSLQQEQRRTRFGTNPLVGDIGSLEGLTPQAKQDGRELLQILHKIVKHLDEIERTAGSNLMGITRTTMISPQVHERATLLMDAANELRDFVSSLKPPGTTSATDSPGSGDDEAMGHLGEEQQPSSALEAIKGGLASILPMLDPPPHTSIFGMDVLRGTVLSRYLGARQLWVARGNESDDAGMIDVLHIPSRRPSITQGPRKAVLYCNPNAGLAEVATGMSLAGGNISDDQDPGTPRQHACWTDFYTELGYDIYLFNYAGFGRSFGTSFCDAGAKHRNAKESGILGRMTRILHGCVLSFKPTPDSLRHDGVALANYIVHELGVEKLIIHGESIGGVAASRAANVVTHHPSTRAKVALLVCDRTFCNLEAVAQRLVGDWSGYAIRMLAPFWNTDVVADFLTAACPKVVANDFTDAIVADASSLKTGVALWKEIKRGLPMSTTKGIGWVMEVPVEYRMADWENTCVLGSQYVAGAAVNRSSPVWPQDKHVTVEEAFHFAACARRVGRYAKQNKSRAATTLDHLSSAMELGSSSGRSEESASSPIQSAWEALACCDGLCGAPLGMTIKIGFDSTVAWLSCFLTFGGQIIVDAAERRLREAAPSISSVTDRPPPRILATDFDQRPEGYQRQDSAKLVHPIPAPEVLDILKSLVAANSRDVFQPSKCAASRDTQYECLDSNSAVFVFP
jgi:pimeloyl-ACP methyl ester carboxylesterase